MTGSDVWKGSMKETKRAPRGHVYLAGGLGAVLLACLTGCVMSVSMGEQQLDAAVTKIDFQARGSLYVVQGDKPRLRMRGRTPTLGSVTANSSGGTLRITETRPPFGMDFSPGAREMAFYLELPNIEDIRHSGEGEMKLGPLTADRLSVVAEDHADLEFSSIKVREFVLNAQHHADVDIGLLEAEHVSMTASSHGDIYADDLNTQELAIEARDQAHIWLAGGSDEARIVVADHASIDASRLKCDVVEIRARDRSAAWLWAEKRLSMVSHDHSNVTWSGNAEVQTQESVPID